MYRDIIINFDLLDEWEDEFIPSGIANNVVQCPSDHTEKEGYSFDLDAENHEDDFQHAVD